MKKILLVVFLLTSVTVFAQAVADYRNVPISPVVTEYRPLPDGGTTISSCAVVLSADGGFKLDKCTQQYAGRTPTQRTALSTCLDNGERVFAMENNIRLDSGF